MLSSISPDQIIDAISRENVSLIQSVKGIGSKTAQRVIIDLHDKILKVYELDEGFASSNNTNKEEALSALLALGFAKKGEGARLVEEERSNYDGEIAINASGGLLSRGHPVGATGLLQTVEIVNQLRGEATGYQVPDAKIGLIETMGGAQPAMDGITCVVSILGK